MGWIRVRRRKGRATILTACCEQEQLKLDIPSLKAKHLTSKPYPPNGPGPHPTPQTDQHPTPQTDQVGLKPYPPNGPHKEYLSTPSKEREPNHPSLEVCIAHFQKCSDYTAEEVRAAFAAFQSDAVDGQWMTWRNRPATDWRYTLEDHMGHNRQIQNRYGKTNSKPNRRDPSENPRNVGTYGNKTDYGSVVARKEREAMARQVAETDRPPEHTNSPTAPTTAVDGARAVELLQGLRKAAE